MITIVKRAFAFLIIDEIVTINQANRAIKVFIHIQLISIKIRIFNEKNMLADFYLPRLLNYIKYLTEKLRGQIYPDPLLKKRRVYENSAFWPKIWMLSNISVSKIFTKTWIF